MAPTLALGETRSHRKVGSRALASSALPRRINSSSPARSPGVIKFDILWDRESSTWKSARLSAVSGHAEASPCTALPCCLCHQLSIQPRFSRPRDLMVELPWPEPPLQC